MHACVSLPCRALRRCIAALLDVALCLKRMRYVLPAPASSPVLQRRPPSHLGKDKRVVLPLERLWILQVVTVHDSALLSDVREGDESRHEGRKDDAVVGEGSVRDIPPPEVVGHPCFSRLPGVRCRESHDATYHVGGTIAPLFVGRCDVDVV